VPGVPIFEQFIVLTPIVKRGGKLKVRLLPVSRRTKKHIFKYEKLIILLFILPVFAFAKVHTVDNTPGNGAMFNSLQTAISSASSGDTIIVMRSIDSYGSISIKKKLFLYSDGHHHPSIFKDRRH
jgi:hypothetical protein